MLSRAVFQDEIDELSDIDCDGTADRYDLAYSPANAGAWDSLQAATIGAIDANFGDTNRKSF